MESLHDTIDKENAETTELNLQVITVSEKNVENRKSLCCFNKVTLQLKLSYAFIFGGFGATIPFLSAFAITRLGLTASNLAATFIANQILMIPFRLIIGYLVDYLNKLKEIFILLIVIYAISTLLLFNIPRLDVRQVMHDYNTRENDSMTIPIDCHFCDIYEKFQSTVSSLPLDKSVFQRKIKCTHKHDTYRINLHCSSENKLSSESIIKNYEFTYRSCTNLNKTFVDTDHVNSERFAEDIFFLILSVNQTEIISITCERSIKIKYGFDDFDLTSILMNKYCYILPMTYAVELNLLMPELYFINKNISCDHFLVNETPRVTSVSTSVIFKTYQFWFFTAVMIISGICMSSICTISDTACYERIQNTDIKFGQIRVYGSISWGLMAPLAGFLIDCTDNFNSGWILMFVLGSMQIFNLTKMNLLKPDFSKNMMKDLKNALSSYEFLAFEIGVYMNGVFTCVIWFYLTWFIKDIGGNDIIIGLSHFVQCFLGELPCMVLSNRMIEKLGHYNVLSVSLFTFGVRFLLYNYITNPWWILPIEMLSGITFGLFYPAITSYAKKSSKPGTEATTQAIMQTTYGALGAGTGIVVYGICFDKFGSHTTFFYSSFICALCGVINMVLTAVIKIRKKKENPDLTEKLSIN